MGTHLFLNNIFFHVTPVSGVWLWCAARCWLWPLALHASLRCAAAWHAPGLGVPPLSGAPLALRPGRSFCPPAAAPELSALAVSKLESALREIAVTGAADYVAQHAPVPGQRRGGVARPTPEPASQAGEAALASPEAPAEPASQAAGEGGEEGTPGAGSLGQQRPTGQRQLTDSVRDLDRCARAPVLLLAHRVCPLRSRGQQTFLCSRLTGLCLDAVQGSWPYSLSARHATGGASPC